jgi:hypothetical protein
MLRLIGFVTVIVMTVYLCSRCDSSAMDQTSTDTRRHQDVDTVIQAQKAGSHYA